MHIEWVKAVAFGPLSDEILRLHPGLNIIIGPNESAKSTWHAAIYAAICGRRRGRGAHRVEDRHFAQRHRPWGQQTWQVQCQLLLDDGRRVELHHDLDAKVDCAATDVSLGRDVSSEIIHDGSPDASRWLGMNRDIFFATACVRQAEILSVLNDAAGLQHQLEAAATHAGTSDPNAAQAIAAVDSFLRDHVGPDRSNSRKPWRMARTSEMQARDALDEAERQHAEYTELAHRAGVLTDAAETLERQAVAAAARSATLSGLAGDAAALDRLHDEIKSVQQTLARQRAERDALAVRLATAHTLSSEVGDSEPVSAADDQRVAASVARAIAAWTSRPQPPPPTGPDAQELRDRLSRTPGPPDGDLQVAVDVLAAWNALLSADAVADSVESREPPGPVSADAQEDAAIVAGSAALRTWASQLRSIEEVPEPDLQAARQATAATRERRDAAWQAHMDASDTRSRRGSSIGLVAAAVLAVVGLALLLTGSTALGSGVMALALIVFGVSALSKSKGTAPQAHMTLLRFEQELAKAQANEASLTATAARAAAAREALTQQCAAAGVPPDPTALLRLAQAVDDLAGARQRISAWEQEIQTQRAAVALAEQRLSAALQSRGIMCRPAEARAAYAQYAEVCDQRAVQARRHAEAAVVAEQLQAREAADAAVAAAREACGLALAGLLSAAMAAGVTVSEHHCDDGDHLVALLTAWADRHDEEMQHFDQRVQAWTGLQTALNGLTLEELHAAHTHAQDMTEHLQRELEQAQKQAEQAWGRLRDAAADAGVILTERGSAAGELNRLVLDVEETLAAYRRDVLVASSQASAALGQLREREANLPSVAEAEEALAVSHAELQRVETLRTTLELTKAHLSAAQEQVHRDIAPTLQTTLLEALPAVTQQRYTAAVVDPRTLQVTVKTGSGTWVPADRLSHGTAEQIYLLLRVALVTHLSNPDTSCPLLLDDVTVQADQIRTGALLDTLARLARDRQVVLFAQDPAVDDWSAQRDDVHVVRLGQRPP